MCRWKMAPYAFARLGAHPYTAVKIHRMQTKGGPLGILQTKDDQSVTAGLSALKIMDVNCKERAYTNRPEI